MPIAHRPRLWPLLLLAGLVLRLLAGAAEAPWHHAGSPFRALFKVTAQPNVPSAGYWLRVPVCGLGEGTWRNVFVFDQQGQAVPVLALGPTVDNCALVVAAPRQKLDGTVYAYFGGSMRPPAAPGMFTPGLFATIRALPPKLKPGTWAETGAAIEQAAMIGVVAVRRLEMAANPLDVGDLFVMDFQGFLRADKPDRPELFLVADDFGCMLLHGKPVIDYNPKVDFNQAQRGGGRQPFDLKPGLSPFRCVVANTGGRAMAVLGRWYSNTKKEVLNESAFAQSGDTQWQGVDARFGGQPCPSFTCEPRSYVGLDNTIYTEVELRALADQPLQWRLGNGLEGRGKRFTAITVGTANIEVTAQAPGNGPPARGAISFATVPRQLRWQQWPVYRQYLETMQVPPADKLNTATLWAYLRLAAVHERTAFPVPFAKALLARKPGAPEGAERRELLLALARAAAMTAKLEGEARNAYESLLADHNNANGTVFCEYAEFLLYRAGDLAAAAKLLARTGPELPGGEAPPRLLLAAELALLQGDRNAAAKALDRLRAASSGGSSFQIASMQANAALESYRKNQENRFCAAAEANLRAWGQASPASLENGQFALVRAQWLRSLRWPAGALASLDAALTYSDLPAFLPDLLLEKAGALRDLDRGTEATALLRQIAANYPKHPAADAARRLLQETAPTP